MYIEVFVIVIMVEGGIGHIMDIMRYQGIVNFLGNVLGAQYEILLQDVKKKAVVSACNGFVLRVEGDPLTSFAKKIVEEELWKYSDYLTNLKCYNKSGHLILSSIYFIKNEDELLGLLSINFDTTQYLSSGLSSYKMRTVLSSLSSLKLDGNESITNTSAEADLYKAGIGTGGFSDVSPDENILSVSQNIENTIEKVINDHLLMNNVPAERLTHNERRVIIESLNDKEVFQFKNSIRYTAKLLSRSETSIYRYLKEIKS